MKVCTGCKESKTTENFSKDRQKKDGLCSRCKLCNSAWHKNNYKQNSEVIKKQTLMYKKANPEKRKQQRKEYYRRNKARHFEYSSYRRAQKKQATPVWADRFYIQDIYENVKEAEKLFGWKMHVDHVVPLTNSKVCGLHNQFNLQVLTKEQNLRKHNTFDEGSIDG